MSPVHSPHCTSSGGRGHCCSPLNCLQNILINILLHNSEQCQFTGPCCLQTYIVRLKYYVLIGIGSMSVCVQCRLMLQYIPRYCGKTLSWGVVGKILKLNPIF